MDGMLRQSFLSSGRKHHNSAEYDHFGNVLKNIQEEERNSELFSKSCSLVDADPSKDYLDKLKIKPNLLQQSFKSIMNPYGGESNDGQNSYLTNCYSSNYGIMGLSFSPITSFLPFGQENPIGSPYELEPQSTLFYMQQDNFNPEENAYFHEPKKVKFKLNPEAKEYIPIALLSRVKENLQTDINCVVNHPMMETINESSGFDYGFIRDNYNNKLNDCCSFNSISPSKQIKTDLSEKARNNFCDSGTSKDIILKDKTTAHLDIVPKNYPMDDTWGNINVASNLSQFENIEMIHENNYIKYVSDKNLSSENVECKESNNFLSISDVAGKMQQAIDVLEKDTVDVYLTAEIGELSDESGDDAENDYDSDSCDEDDAVTSEENDYPDENDECVEGLKSDESFIKFGSLDSNDSNIYDECKPTKEVNCSGSDSAKAKSSIFSLICNPDSDSESCNAEDSDYDYDIFSVQLDDGWDLSCGGLQISAFISHCSPAIGSKDSLNSDLSVIDGLNKICSDCTILCDNIGGEELETVPNMASINEKWKEEINKNLSSKTLTKVSFKDDVEIHSSIDWDRHGPWEQYARDRMRFARRIEETEPILTKVLTPEHRLNIYQKLTKI